MLAFVNGETANVAVAESRQRSRVCLVLVGVLTACQAGCIARDRLNPDCEWTDDSSAHLNVAVRGDRDHLMMDANTAEELAIRHADAHRGRRSGHWAGWDEYHATRERCLSTLVATIGETHDVEPAVVRSLIGGRSAGFDLAVLLAFAVLYMLTAYLAAGTIVSRFPRDEPVPAAIATALISVLTSVAGLMAFALWAATAEMVRLGNQHMSYRVGRLPWRHHYLELLLVGIALFWAMTAIRYRRARASVQIA